MKRKQFKLAYCEVCKEECIAKIVDYGIGPYEYWGATGVDSDLHAVSDCCEGFVFRDQELTDKITVDDVKRKSNEY